MELVTTTVVLDSEARTKTGPSCLVAPVADASNFDGPSAYLG